MPQCLRMFDVLVEDPGLVPGTDGGHLVTTSSRR